MRNSYLQPIADKLQRRNKKIIYVDSLKKLIESIMEDQYSDKKAYKIIYHLKNKGHLVSLKRSIFYIKKPSDIYSDDVLIEDRYRTLLHNHCQRSHKKKRYVGGIKALELNFQSLEIPDEVLVVTEKKQGTEVILGEKTVNFKKYTNNGDYLFPLFFKHTEKVKIGRYSFRYANKELAVVETLYNFDKLLDRYAYEMVKKILKKTKQRDIGVWESIMKSGKHHSSINRLYDIAKKQNPKLAEELLTSIKRFSFVLDI